MNTTMTEEMNVLIEAIKADFAQWGEVTEIRAKLIEKFNENISYTVGKKYIKVVKESSVWGFIVNTENDKKFKKGDILKAASWEAPARNKPRGNIIEGGYKIQWTGPHYL